MDPEPRNVTVDTSQLHWNNGAELSPVVNATPENRTDGADAFDHGGYVKINVIIGVTVLICLCGLAGNGTVVWLLGFRVKRNPYSVYILNLAVADFTCLLAFSIIYTAEGLDIFLDYNSFPLLYYLYWLLFFLSYGPGQCLLMAISTERCVSVLWPIWYKCRRPAQLSAIVCSLIWALSFIFLLGVLVFKIHLKMHHIHYILPLITFLVLSVCGLTLVIRVQCGSRQRKPSKLYVTILLNVLAFLLLGVPRAAILLDTYWWERTLGDTARLISDTLYVMNCSINPVIYFLVGRQGQQRGRKTLRQLLQNALKDECEGAEQRRGVTSPRQDETPGAAGGPC